MTEIELTIKTLSPIHLSCGDADVIVDSEADHDRYGMPVFSGRRFKGLLHESALEVVGMKGMEKYNNLMDRLFDRDGRKECPEALIVSDFHIKPREEYVEQCKIMEMLQRNYGGIIGPNDVLDVFSSIRYQTKLTNGVAAKWSFRNIRVVDENVNFYGVIAADKLSEEALELLALSVRNLRAAGMKRNRGFGHINCSITLADKRTEQDIIDKLFAREER